MKIKGIIKFLKSIEIKKINFDKLYIFISLFLSVIWLFLAWKTYYIAIPEYQEFIEKNEIPNLNWNWEFTFITEKSNLKKYIWMTDKYDIFLIWSKDEYKWKWEKFESYWHIIEPKNRARVEFEIVVKKNNLYWFFTANDTREYNWNFEVRLNKDWKKIEWIFTTSAANSKWKMIWVKKQP